MKEEFLGDKKMQGIPENWENLPDIEEDLPFLPESMKKAEKTLSLRGESQDADSEVILFGVKDDEEPQEKETGNSLQKFGGIPSWEEGSTGIDYDGNDTLEMAEEDSVYSERKYIILIIYDIISNKQRVKMAKLLSGYGTRVQKSAFEARLTKKQYARLLADIKKMLRADDNVRIYKLHSYEEILTFGDKEYETFEDVIVI